MVGPNDRKTRSGWQQCRQPGLYPGWFVNSTPSESAVWVMNEKFFLGRMDHEPPRLKRDQIARITTGIAMHVRNRQKNG